MDLSERKEGAGLAARPRRRTGKGPRDGKTARRGAAPKKAAPRKAPPRKAGRGKPSRDRAARTGKPALAGGARGAPASAAGNRPRPRTSQPGRPALEIVRPNTRRPGRVALLIGTRKGAFLYASDPSRRKWKVSGPHMLGSTVHHMVLDPRDGRTLLMAARTGHLGPTIFRSTDGGKSWKEAVNPPAFPRVPEGETGPSVHHTFWLSPGHASERDVWWAGTAPHGLFRSGDGGASWEPVEGFNGYLKTLAKPEERLGETPGGKLTHSILVDPRDAGHMYIGLST